MPAKAHSNPEDLATLELKLRASPGRWTAGRSTLTDICSRDHAAGGADRTMRSMPSDGCSLCIGAVQAIRTPVAANKAAASDVAMPCQAYAQQKPESNSPCPALSPAAGSRSYRRATADQARELGASPTSRARSLSSSAAGAPTIRIETGSRETMPCFSKSYLDETIEGTANDPLLRRDGADAQ
jgi:hypothetical protein